MQCKLTTISEDIGKFGLGAAVGTVLVLTIIFIVNAMSSDSFEAEQFKELLEYFIIGVAIVVVAIPEGLPLAVTLSLAYSTK